jgi:CBS domain-containing membrane protein
MSTLKVSDVMSRDPVTMTEGDDLADAKSRMLEKRIRHLPVVDEDGRLIGLLTQRDLLRLRESPFSGTLPDEQTAMDRWSKVGEVMTRGVRMITADTPVLEAAELLREEPIGCLPVIDDGRVVGILTESDFVSLVIRMLSDPGR